MKNPGVWIIIDVSHRHNRQVQVLAMATAASIDKEEIARFSSHAQEWWNPQGALRPLHKLNPARLAYIRDIVCEHFKRKAGETNILKNLTVLDIGCGGGLLCEPLARLGATVTGLDASSEAIEVARAHVAQTGLSVHYQVGSAETFARSGKKFDVITALEILEHVADIDSFLIGATRLLKPNGIIILSTLNRTPKSFFLGILAAEYILKWVPRGTHDWRKFIRPSELASHLLAVGMKVSDITGMTYDPLNDAFCLRKGDVSVNYLLAAVKA
jgi:2-polyprenyl-6-hydroxyphenyl methylase/3-demethylubiquinone-9 3-methyltransferase